MGHPTLACVPACDVQSKAKQMLHTVAENAHSEVGAAASERIFRNTDRIPVGATDESMTPGWAKSPGAAFQGAPQAGRHNLCLLT
mmetsp:Transcript_78634/g.254735  ORF Transcript_78634/g.254735 Transcript_78634/m.254735 type:complete len:85 (+) Transcript_78634:512-766(+)